MEIDNETEQFTKATLSDRTVLCSCVLCWMQSYANLKVFTLDCSVM